MLPAQPPGPSVPLSQGGAHLGQVRVGGSAMETIALLGNEVGGREPLMASQKQMEILRVELPGLADGVGSPGASG